MTTDKERMSLANPILLNKIDELFACGVGDQVPLPQIVVVGDQSSGKSSVLEGLTNLPFPRDSGLCTKFATQITFRRAQENIISVSIIPGKDASPEHSVKAQAWIKKNLKSLDAKLFGEIMIEVQAVMGIGTPRTHSQRTFSDDVLRLEIAGPEQEHLSVVDVPGIFRKYTEGITTKEDSVMVRSMVQRYMENPRSVMLTVVPSNTDIAVQEILTMAEEADHLSNRTIGVLTKPDLVDEGAENSAIELVNGNKHRLALGWCLVKNPGQKQLEDPKLNRHTIEKAFFDTKAPWDKVDKDRVGIEALRVRLQEILADHIRREFPKVKSEINKKLAASKQALERLGDGRDTEAEQRRYLLAISVRFQNLTDKALDANFSGDDWFDKYPGLRLVNQVVNRSEKFADDFKKYGHSYEFQNPETNDQGPEDGQEEGSKGEEEQEDAEEEEEEQLSIHTTTSHEDLFDLMPTESSISKRTGRDILDWLSRVFKLSRGLEMGPPGGALLASTMKTQTAKWEVLALGYISDVITMTHSYILDLLRLLCPGQRVRDGLYSILSEELMVRYKKAQEQIYLLLRQERMGTPFTLNHYFNDNLEKCRQNRLRESVRGKAIFVSSLKESMMRLKDIMANHPMPNTDHVIQEIHDVLRSYYKVARKRFVDNVCV